MLEWKSNALVHYVLEQWNHWWETTPLLGPLGKIVMPSWFDVTLSQPIIKAHSSLMPLFFYDGWYGCLSGFGTMSVMWQWCGSSGNDGKNWAHRKYECCMQLWNESLHGTVKNFCTAATCCTAATLQTRNQVFIFHGWDFSGYSQISGFRYLPESN